MRHIDLPGRWLGLLHALCAYAAGAHVSALQTRTPLLGPPVLAGALAVTLAALAWFGWTSARRARAFAAWHAAVPGNGRFALPYAQAGSMAADIGVLLPRALRWVMQSRDTAGSLVGSLLSLAVFALFGGAGLVLGLGLLLAAMCAASPVTPRALTVPAFALAAAVIPVLAASIRVTTLTSLHAAMMVLFSALAALAMLAPARFRPLCAGFAVLSAFAFVASGVIS